MLGEIEKLDILESEGRGNDELIRNRAALKNELEDILIKEKRSMGQKMKFKWAKEGDVNSRLFSKVVNVRRRKNFIKELEDDEGRVLRDQHNIERDITLFYKNLFTEEENNMPFLDGLNWDPISEDVSLWLERPFEEEEIRKAVFELEGDKAPGLDGFS